MTDVEALREELGGLPEAIEAAAVLGDAAHWARLSMRKVALEVEIREAELEPLRGNVARRERDLREAERERERALEAEPPDVPAARRHAVTGDMLKRQLVQSATRSSENASRDLRAARERLKAAEREGVRTGEARTTTTR